MMQYSVKAQLTDLLNSEKFITSAYNSALNESATPELRTAMSGIAAEEHRIQNELFDEMNSRGLYPVNKAEENKVKQAKEQYGCKCNCTQQ